MKNKTFRWFYLLSLVGVTAAAFWPFCMGVRVIRDMIVQGTVMSEDYPKYIIPYLPVALAVLVGVALMPLLMRVWGRRVQLGASGIALALFLTSELLLEKLVTVTGRGIAKLESWQMSLCYVSPEIFESRTWRPIDVLIGEYSPWFKLHFYIIAIVLIFAFLNCFYGFGQMILSGKRERLRHLILQSVAAVLFLGLCIFACFTAFYRTGEITVSPLSAFLMCLFFIVFGVTMGIFTASFLTKHQSSVVLSVSASVASAVTLIMYIGELILLSGHLYRLGNGVLFEGLGVLVLAPIDLIVILLSGVITVVALNWIANRQM